jgi:hypothetical protein
MVLGKIDVELKNCNQLTQINYNIQESGCALSYYANSLTLHLSLKLAGGTIPTGAEPSPRPGRDLRRKICKAFVLKAQSAMR